MTLDELIAAIRRIKRQNPAATKAEITSFLREQRDLVEKGSVFSHSDFSLRVSKAKEASFSNTVLALSKLREVDSKPFVSCVVRPNDVQFLLCNSTFIAKVSHSSRDLRIDNIRGSFNGSNIILNYGGVANVPENFSELFAIHSEFEWDENLERLVEATNAIVSRASRFEIPADLRERILTAPLRARRLVASRSYRSASQRFESLVAGHRAEILTAALIDNGNLRGNKIEQILTGEIEAHRMDDFIVVVDGVRLSIDIKTKLLERASAPKGYNIDKVLRRLSESDTAFDLLLVGVDTDRGRVSSRLVSIFDPALLSATRVQHHWAGRGSRGVTQFVGDITDVFEKDYRPSIDVGEAQRLLQDFIDR